MNHPFRAIRVASLCLTGSCPDFDDAHLGFGTVIQAGLPTGLNIHFC